MSKKNVEIKHNQNLFDVVIQYYGSIEAIQDFLADNPHIIGIDAFLTKGTVVKIDDSKISDRQNINYIQTNNLTIATGDSVNGDGINYWGIEEDFVIQ